MREKTETTDFLRTANRWAALGFSGVFLLLGWAVAMSGADHLRAFLFLLFAPWVVILIHELGHAAAASLVGWRVWVINAFPIAWRRTTPTFLFGAGTFGPDVGGFVAGAPKKQIRNTLANELVFVAGGPLSNLIVAAACIASAMFAWPQAIEHMLVAHEPIRALVMAFGLHSCAAAMWSAWPVTSQAGTKNDGAIALSLLFERSSRAESDAIGYAAMLWTYGVTPRDWDSWISAGIEAAAENAETASAAKYFLMMRAMERLDYQLACQIQAALKQVDPPLEGLAFIDAFLAAVAKDYDDAETILSAIATPPEFDTDYFLFQQLTRAIIISGRGDHRAAEKAFDGFTERLRTGEDYPSSFWQGQLAHAKALVRMD